MTVLPQENLACISGFAALSANLLCSATRRSGRLLKTAEQTRRVAALCLQFRFDPSPSCCGKEPLTAACMMTMVAQRGTVELFFTKKPG